MKKCKETGKYFRFILLPNIYLSKVFGKSFNKTLNEYTYTCSIIINSIDHKINRISYMVRDCVFHIIRAKQISKEEFLKELSEFDNKSNFKTEIEKIIRNEKM